MYLAIYVDDGLLCGKNERVLIKLLECMHKDFKITYSKAECFVGLQIEKDRAKGKLKIHQKCYVNEVLNRFNHEICAPLSIPAEPGIKFSEGSKKEKEKKNFPYREAIGSLMYLIIGTRPDIAYIVGVLSRCMENHEIEHWHGVQRILKSLKGTIDHGITFDIGTNKINLIAYCDADFAEDVNDRKSTTVMVCFLNSGPISWNSRKQTVTATSTTEAEFVALCSATKEVVWLRRLLGDLSHTQTTPTTIFCDNQRAITIIQTPESIKSTKHIEVQFFFTCEKQAKNEINIKYVSTEKQLADTLTKPLAREKFEGFKASYGMN